MRRAIVLVLALSLGLAAPAFAQAAPERELEIVKALFDAGDYATALKRADEALALPGFADAQRIELERVAGLSAFNLGQSDVAAARFLGLLTLNPDFVLDPFSAPPPALKRFEQVRQEHAEALNLVRQQLALKAEQAKRAEADKEKQRLEEVEKRVRAEMLARGTTVRTVERHSLLLNFVPFGVGQFEQGRSSWGVAFAIGEGVLAAASLGAVLFRQSLFTPVTYTWLDRLTADNSGRYTVTVSGIPGAQRDAAANARLVANLSAAAFYLAWGAGVIDALLHHSSETVTEKREAAPAPRVSVSLVPGGASAALSIDF